MYTVQSVVHYVPCGKSMFVEATELESLEHVRNAFLWYFMVLDFQHEAEI